MTPEERLQQIETLLGTAAKYINRHEELLNRHEELHARYEQQVVEVNLRMAQAASMVSELAAIARQNQEENRRIWQYLLSQRPENGHSN
jgi:hypothetical protein